MQIGVGISIRLVLSVFYESGDPWMLWPFFHTLIPIFLRTTLWNIGGHALVP